MTDMTHNTALPADLLALVGGTARTDAIVTPPEHADDAANGTPYSMMPPICISQDVSASDVSYTIPTKCLGTIEQDRASASDIPYPNPHFHFCITPGESAETSPGTSFHCLSGEDRTASDIVMTMPQVCGFYGRNDDAVTASEVNYTMPRYHCSDGNENVSASEVSHTDSRFNCFNRNGNMSASEVSHTDSRFNCYN